MHNISSSLLTEVAPFAFVVDASVAQLPPGQWPAKIQIVGLWGDNRTLFLDRSLRCGGKRYKQSAGCVSVDILND